jgi:prepilin-type N-terminal cleavage/methylation domain-containing protein
VLKNSHKKGFVLLEVIIAIVIIAISLLSFFHFVSPSFSMISSRPLFLDTLHSVSSSSLNISQKCATLISFGFECSLNKVDVHAHQIGDTATMNVELADSTFSNETSWYILQAIDPQTQQKFSMIVYEP